MSWPGRTVYHRRMNASFPGLLFKRVPPPAQTVLAWCAALAFVVVSLVALPSVGRSFPHGFGGFAVVMAFPAVVLYRRPLPVLVMLLAEAVVFAIAGGPNQIPLLQFLAADVAVCFIAATRPRRTSIVAGVAALGALAGYSAAPTLGGHSAFDTAPWSALALTVVVAWTIGNSIRQRDDYAEILHTQAAAQAITAERLRIARELHDMVAHCIGIIAIQAGTGRRVIDTQPVEARNALDAIETTSRETLAGLRRMLGALRHAETDPAEAAPAAGLGDLDRLTATAMDAGVHIDLSWRGDRRPLPPMVDLSAFRIIQEAVTNVVRHAGTPHCQVSVDYTDDMQLCIEIVDDGPGRSGAGTGYGIAGMRERVGLLHGDFDAAPRPQGGFRVAARLPR
jgi:signal transduction histidine kinase